MRTGRKAASRLIPAQIFTSSQIHKASLLHSLRMRLRGQWYGLTNGRIDKQFTIDAKCYINPAYVYLSFFFSLFYFTVKCKFPTYTLLNSISTTLSTFIKLLHCVMMLSQSASNGFCSWFYKYKKYIWQYGAWQCVERRHTSQKHVALVWNYSS